MQKKLIDVKFINRKTEDRLKIVININYYDSSEKHFNKQVS